MVVGLGSWFPAKKRVHVLPSGLADPMYTTVHGVPSSPLIDPQFGSGLPTDMSWSQRVVNSATYIVGSLMLWVVGRGEGIRKAQKQPLPL